MSETRSKPARRTDEAPYAPRVRAWKDDEVFAAERHVRELIEHPGWILVQGLLSDARESSLQRVIHTAVLEQAVYARALGQVSGLEQSGIAARAVLSAAEDVRREIGERQEQ